MSKRNARPYNRYLYLYVLCRVKYLPYRHTSHAYLYYKFNVSLCTRTAALYIISAFKQGELFKCFIQILFRKISNCLNICFSLYNIMMLFFFLIFERAYTFFIFLSKILFRVFQSKMIKFSTIIVH